MERIQEELNGLHNRGRFRSLADTRERRGTVIEFNGQNLLNLSSNDYLGGIGSRQDLFQQFLAESAEQLGNYALTSSSSRLLTGNHPLYDQLEENLASLYQRDAGLVFNSGYHANTGSCQPCRPVTI